MYKLYLIFWHDNVIDWRQQSRRKKKGMQQHKFLFLGNEIGWHGHCQNEDRDRADKPCLFSVFTMFGVLL
ncbi:hypothetical protein HMPREF0083_03088 [Aneurinibacillus aneurinilyticus ATCC 12856]|uniref:Uncharacterized protein n=1 Tax=Aneurinibacillus aneurinilyticus ATCC 12856 TaxID=649747 RepID=U1YDH0_ANEAE|nr:hypothetical protein HMPREF0083_03088 [Aneurinibacillus aneurinilyticus ATCC 12856]